MRTGLKRFCLYWLPAISYAGLIYLLSSMPDIKTPAKIWNFDKLIHLLEFGILSFLLARAFALQGPVSWRRNCRFLAIALTILYALSDEFHQLFIPGRSCEFLDLFFDSLGALIGQKFYS